MAEVEQRLLDEKKDQRMPPDTMQAHDASAPATDLRPVSSEGE
jgi:hypothetical protein